MTKDKKNKDLPNNNALLKGVTSSTTADNEKATTSINVSVAYDRLLEHKDAAFKDLAKNFKSDGFRPGKVSPSILKKEIPEILVLERAGREVMADIYLPLLQKHKIDGIGEPNIQITKMAADNPFEFTITLANVPTVELADYKKVIKDQKGDAIDPEVTDEELEAAINTLRHQWAQQDAYQNQVSADPEVAKTLDPRQIKVTDEDLPELTVDWIKNLGEYETVDAFRDAFRTNIKTNKAMEELDKRRATALSKVVEQSTFNVPEIVYSSEQDRLFELRKAEVKQAGLKLGDYLKTLGKTEGELRTSMHDAAVSRVHSQMVIAEIARNESLLPNAELVNKEVEYLTKMYPDADKTNLVAYVQSQLTTNEVLQFLVSPAAEPAKPKAKAADKTVKKPAAKDAKKKDSKTKTDKKVTKKDKK